MFRTYTPWRWSWLAALILVVTVPVAQVAVAADHASVVCCCGEHDASNDCGCPDCPSAVHGESDERGDHGPAVAADAIKRCGTDSFLGTPPGHFDVTLAARLGRPERFGPVRPPPPPPGFSQTVTVPESPPPEFLFAF